MSASGALIAARALTATAVPDRDASTLICSAASPAGALSRSERSSRRARAERLRSKRDIPRSRIRSTSPIFVQSSLHLMSPGDDEFLVQPAEVGVLANSLEVHLPRQPFGDFVTPQIERIRLEPSQQRPEHVRKRMPESWAVIIDDNDLPARPYHAHDLSERSAPHRVRLLVQQEEDGRLAVTGTGEPERSGVALKQRDRGSGRQRCFQIAQLNC